MSRYLPLFPLLSLPPLLLTLSLALPSGNVIALVLFLSPVYEQSPLSKQVNLSTDFLYLPLSRPTFVKICKKKSVEQFSAIPYLATLLNCMLWVVYGLPLVHPHSILVITINGAGLVIELTYVLLFLLYSQGRTRLRVLVIFLAEVAFVAVVAIVVLATAHTYDRRSLIVGSLCVFFGTMMYVAPLSVMVRASYSSP